MQKITDLTGREWRLSVNAASIERVRDESGVDLYEYGMHGEHEELTKTLMFRLRADPFLLSHVLYSLLRRQADEATVNWESFCEAFSDSALWAARDALEAEIAVFTVSPDRRDAIRAATQKISEMMAEAHRFVLAKTLQTIQDPAIDAELQSELRKLGERFGKTPASPAPEIPGPTPTAS